MPGHGVDHSSPFPGRRASAADPDRSLGLEPGRTRQNFRRLTRQNFRNQQALRRANLRRIRFHDLRHTYASLLIAQGAHPKYIQAQLGHASIQTTLDRYGHLMPDAHAAEARKLDRLVFGENGRDGAARVIADAVQRVQTGSRDDEGVSEHAR
jgi:integrase